MHRGYTIEREFTAQIEARFPLLCAELIPGPLILIVHVESARSLNLRAIAGDLAQAGKAYEYAVITTPGRGGSRMYEAVRVSSLLTMVREGIRLRKDLRIERSVRSR